MAINRTDGKTLLNSLSDLGSLRNESGSDDTVNLREQKKRSRIMYKKRKLDKDIKYYIKNTVIIKWKTIDRIAQGHGFYFG